MNTKLNLLSLIACCSMTTFVNAATITTGSLVYDDVSGIITDSVGGKTYLGWDILMDKTYAETVAATSIGGAYSSWHIADQSEAFDFFHAAGGVGVDTIGVSNYYRLQLGGAVGSPFGNSYNTSSDYTFFLSAEDREVGYLGNTSTSIFINDTWANIVTADQYSTIGFLLVGGTANQTTGATSVPSPSSITLLGLGLLGLAGYRKKSQA